MPSNQIMRNAIDKAMVYRQLQADRQLCCDPYDCMCHEMCDSELGYCGGCKGPQINGKRFLQISDYERQSPNKVGS